MAASFLLIFNFAILEMKNSKTAFETEWSFIVIFQVGVIE